MNRILYFLYSVLFFITVISPAAKAQQMSNLQDSTIVEAVFLAFDNSLKEAEKLNVPGIFSTLNTASHAGFMDNGRYYDSINELRTTYSENISGLMKQSIWIDQKHVTVLSPSYALLTATGNSSATLKDGRVFTGSFVWTFVYILVDGQWKVFHSHMSNP